MKKFSYSIESNALMHSGGTKYYRVAKAAIRQHGANSVFVLFLNYGPFKSTKGDLDKHLPMHGGTSSVLYFDDEAKLNKRFNAEMGKRATRGYMVDHAHSVNFNHTDATELELQSVLRGSVGIIAAHYAEVTVELDSTADATVDEKPDVKREFAEHIKKVKESISEKHGVGASRTKSRMTSEKEAKGDAPVTPKPEIDRGPEWGSW